MTDWIQHSRERPRDGGAVTADDIVQRPSLGDEVYQRLFSDFLSLKIPPGERLSVDALARRFGVSQTPIRAALIRLEAEGLVVKKHYSGYSVAPIPSSRRFADIIEARLLLEPASAAHAARRASTAERAEIAELAAEMHELAAGDLAEHTARLVLLDSRFHSAIARACGNAAITDALDRLLTQMHIFRLRYHADVARAVIDEHLLILAAIEGRDAGAAEARMRAHVDRARERIEPFVRSGQ
ncbi:GntR family transcriptional regulator [Aurantimonas sp. 22II-16-19i]|uniref:GntR family transcriptional regulator n=1 Tax=Aurantimonas sp. 22II-16-19i TaxID=1317114 RepID=UPI0009F7B6E4|nr:GntR family transcriptional regulator [Aurantimonas sp. 22II-16-19i]ORE98432.1 GntR family transcriptional regulator [Aurantimonas sp. 22II-16-19i]